MIRETSPVAPAAALFGLRRYLVCGLIFAVTFVGFSALVPVLGIGSTAIAQAADDAAAAAPALAAEADEERSALEWLVEALGIYLIVFFLLSMALIALLIMNFLALRRQSVCHCSP